MEAKRLAVIGYGGRGGIYGEYAIKYPEQFKLVAKELAFLGEKKDSLKNIINNIYSEREDSV